MLTLKMGGLFRINSYTVGSRFDDEPLWPEEFLTPKAESAVQVIRITPPPRQPLVPPSSPE
jgi:hypothetical protein